MDKGGVITVNMGNSIKSKRTIEGNRVVLLEERSKILKLVQGIVEINHVSHEQPFFPSIFDRDNKS